MKSCACPDCARLLRQIAETRLHERREVIKLLLALRVNVKDGYDAIANHTLEQAARAISDVRVIS